MRHEMGIARLAICSIAFVAFWVIALVIANPYLVKMAFRSQAERDYLRLVSEGKTEVYVAYPELIERIVKDKQFAETNTTVHLLGPKGESMDFASLRELPNLATVTVDYCHQVETVISTLDTLTALEEVHFFFCFPQEAILPLIDNPSLSEIAIHSHRPFANADQLVDETKVRLPNCTIKLTND